MFAFFTVAVAHGFAPLETAATHCFSIRERGRLRAFGDVGLPGQDLKLGEMVLAERLYPSSYALPMRKVGGDARTGRGVRLPTKL